MRLVIVGGGFIGQLLHVLFPKARCLDWSLHPPNTPTRQLGPQYLWERIEELPCWQFIVRTTIDGQDATAESILAYKHKVEKEQDNGDWRSQFRPTMDGWTCELPEPRVEYGKRILNVDWNSRTLHLASGEPIRYDLLLNTVSLDMILQMCGASRPQFKSRPIYMHVASLGPSAVPGGSMHVNYISYPNTPVYRQTIRDNQVHTESLAPFDFCETGTRVQRFVPGKIYNHESAPECLARLAAYGIACFGRYATWSPDELAHETYRKAKLFKEQHGL